MAKFIAAVIMAVVATSMILGAVAQGSGGANSYANAFAQSSAGAGR